MNNNVITILWQKVFFWHRIDTEAVFKIEINIEGFWKKSNNDSRKIYIKGRTLKWMVDPDKFSLFDLSSDLLDELSWGESQTPKIWILDKKEGRDAALVSESQIPEMFKMFQKEKKNITSCSSMWFWGKLQM
jgi:hypothetical protein